MDIERLVLEAFTQYVSRPAAENLLKRAVKAFGRSPLTPSDWTGLIQGPLIRELGQILPVRGLLPPFKAILMELKANTPPANPAPAPQPPTEETEISLALERVNLSDADARRELVLSLARLEGISGVILETPHGQEVRAPGLSMELVRMLRTAHRLIVTRGRYAMFYTVLESAQLVVRPLGDSWIAVLARSEANLGALLYRLRGIEGQLEAEHLG